jgi:signal peptidase I
MFKENLVCVRLLFMSGFGTSGVPSLGFGRVIVEGTSMQPTYNPLDWLLVHYGFLGRKKLFLKPGSIVVIEREKQPGIFYIKRISEIAVNTNGEKTYYLRSDNESGTDSRTWGFLAKDEIRGRVIARIKNSSKPFL